MTRFQKELAELINKHSLENGSNTPDFILAEYLLNCLHTFNQAIADRNCWYGIVQYPGKQDLIDPNNGGE